MTEAERQALKDLQGQPGFTVLENQIKLKLDELGNISNLNPESSVPMEIQSRGRWHAVKLLKEILSDLGFHKATKKTNTYE